MNGAQMNGVQMDGAEMDRAQTDRARTDGAGRVTAQRRTEPAGLRAGAPLSRAHPPAGALALVETDLAEAEGRLCRLVGSQVAVVEEIGSYLTASGGKRLRPMLTALGARAAGLEGDIAGLMCVGELIHLGSLLHDDVVDVGLLRRDRPAAWTVYGNAATILTGDFCLARAILLAGEEGARLVAERQRAGQPHGDAGRAVTELGRAVTWMAEGEVLQLQRAGSLDTPLADYLEMVEKKSAALIAWCTAAGAWVRGDAQAAAGLYEFGRQAGIAFQIADDVIDYSPASGKSPGQDLRERKLTLPLLHALARVPDLRARLEGPAEALDIPALLTEIRESGALDTALSEARARAEAALKALDVLPEGPWRAALCDLGRYLVERGH